MGIDISDGIGRQPGTTQGRAHAGRSAFARGIRSSDVVGVQTVAPTGEHSQDVRSPSAGVGLAFQEKRAAALADDEAVPIPVKGAGGRRIVAPRERPRLGEA